MATQLCNYAPQELQETIGQVLLNAYKIGLGVGSFTELDEAWLKKVAEAQGATLLRKAQQVLNLETNFATVTGATVGFTAALIDGELAPRRNGVEDRSLLVSFRKPAKKEQGENNG
ncbi:MAG: hypothetical protein PHE55_05060 [Methylococcaceae bacterium]|nr:hypothetical protein [Methylococcaceae bacterium]